MSNQHYNIEAQVQTLDQAKHIAGEWVGMFNTGQSPPVLIEIQPTNGIYLVKAWNKDGSGYGNEDYLDALDILNDLR